MFTAKRKGILALLISVMAAALLAFGVFFALPSTTASAAEDGTVATIGDGAEYTSLQSAINAAAASENATITLTSNVTESVTVPVGKTITLDLNGYTLTNSTGTTITNLGTLTIEDSSNDKTGAVYGNSEYALFNEIGATATLNGGLFTNSGNASYVISNHGTMTINEGVTMIQASGNAVAGPSGIASGYYTPDDKSKTAYLTINGGKFSSPRITIKNDEISYLTINGGEFDVEGTNVQSVQNWTYTTITGGTFYGTVHMWTYDSVPVRGELNIEGGDFKNDIVAWDYDTNAYDENPNVNVYGGNFEVAVKPEYVAEGTYFYPTENGYTASAEEPAAEETTGVAMIGKYVYSSLQAAINAAGEDEEIKLISDVLASEGYVILTSNGGAQYYVLGFINNKDVTIDLNGHSIVNNVNEGGGRVFWIQYGNLTLKSSATAEGTEVVNGTIEGKTAIWAVGSADKHINVDITNVDLITSGQYGVVVAYADFTFENSAMEHEVDSISAQVEAIHGELNSKITIRNSTVTAISPESEQYSLMALTASTTNVIIENSEIISQGSTLSYGVLVHGGYSNAEASEAVADTNCDTYYRLNITGSTIKANAFAVMGNGATHGTVFNITASTIESKEAAAIYHPQYGVLNILGTENKITGETGIEIRAGILTVKGGTISGGSDFETGPNGNGSTSTGAAIAIVQHTTRLPINVTLSDGNYSGARAIFEANIQGNSAEDLEKISLTVKGGTYSGEVLTEDLTNYVSGGSFDTAVKPEYVAEGTYFYPTENGYTASAEEPTADETTGVAMIEGGKYIFATLQAAIDAAEDGDTIVLVNDVAESVTVPAGKTITLDLNGYTLTNAGDNHTIINNGTLTIIDSSENKLGTVDNVNHGRGALVNYGKAILLGGTYTRSAEAGTDPDNNGGNSWYVIDNQGTMDIYEDVTVTSKSAYSSMIRNLGNEQASAVLTIYGGTFSGGLNTLKNDTNGIATLNGGDYGNTSQAVILNWNTLEINGGTFTATEEAQTAVMTGDDTSIETDVTKINGGIFKGNITYYYNPNYPEYGTSPDYSISGGSFDVKPSEDYFAPGYDAPVLGADGYYTTISVAANIEAQADVKLYAAALGIKWSELTEENAAAVLEAYDAIYSAATAEEIAAAKVAAMAELDEYAENAAAALESYKAEMIAAVEAYAAGTTEGATVVAVPTYVVSAIYGATSTAEIDKYVAVAEAEIDELRAARNEAKAEAEKLDQAMADIDSIISALSIAQGEGDTWTSALLEEIKQFANSANTAAGEIKDLIGTPATEGGNNTLAGMIEEAQNEITTAINEAKAAIVEVLEGADGNGGLKAEIAEVKGVADSLAALFDGEGEGDLAAMLEDVSKVVTEVQGNVDKIEADLGVADGSTLAGMIEKLDSADSYLGKAIAGIQTALNAFIESATTEVGAISGKLDELSTAVSKLPTTDNSAAISELKELISTVDGKVDDANDAIDEVSGKVDTISDGVGGALASVNASIGSLAEAQNALKIAVEGYKAAVDNALTSTDTKLEGLAESIEGLAGDNAELKVALELLQQTADDLRDAIDAVDDGNQTDLTAISAAVATLQQSVTELAGNVDAVAGTVNGVAQNNEDTLGGVVALYTFMAVIVVLLVVVLVIVSLKRKR